MEVNRNEITWFSGKFLEVSNCLTLYELKLNVLIHFLLLCTDYFIK